jgi:hypothetical protein
MATVDGFLRTGQLGALSCDIPPEAVRPLLGEPDAVAEGKLSQIWKYGSLQLGFYLPHNADQPQLGSIGLYFHNPDEQPPSVLELTGWKPSGHTTHEEFRSHLEKEAISVSERSTLGSCLYFVLASGVRVTFDEGVLYSIHFTAKHDVATKQLTISIPRQSLDTIRREAVALGLSVSRLCSRWIQERVDDLQPDLSPRSTAAGTLMDKQKHHV